MCTSTILLTETTIAPALLIKVDQSVPLSHLPHALVVNALHMALQPQHQRTQRGIRVCSSNKTATAQAHD
jgi:hypothetical protein